MSELTLAKIDELIKKMPPRVPNAIRINQHTLDVLHQHVDLSDGGTPFAAINISVAEGVPDGTVAFGWDMPGGGFELDALYNITDFTQPRE